MFLQDVLSVACRRLAGGIALLAFFGVPALSPARAVRSDVRAAAPLAITDVTIIDVVTGAQLRGVTVLIRNGRISRIGRGVTIPRASRRIVGSGKFLIPGLWDMHTHLQASGEGSLGLFLANGVVGVRDMGSDLAFILPLRSRISRGELTGPAVVAAGPILDAAPPDWPFRRHVTNAVEARVAVRELKQAGVDFIKVHDNTPRDAFFAIADETRRLGLTFAGHVPSGVTVDEASASGMVSIEHLANYRVFLECSGDRPYSLARCRPLFDRLAANHVWQTPTLAFLETIPDVFSGAPPLHAQYASPSLRSLWRKNQETSKLSEAALTFLRGAGATALVAVKDMRARGDQFLAGCDMLVPGFCLHDEMEWMVRAGLTPLEALQTATLNPARFLGRERLQGTIEVGKSADLVLLDKNPLQDVRNTKAIRGVILHGRFLDRGELDGLIARAPR